MKTYAGERAEHDELSNDVTVTAEGASAPLRLRLDLRKHSPTGFEWGYYGSGPAQLALAILADCVGDVLALRLYQTFKAEVVGKLPRAGWKLSEQDVREWVTAHAPAPGFIVIVRPLEDPQLVEHTGDVGLHLMYQTIGCEMVDRREIIPGAGQAGRFVDAWFDDEGLLNEDVRPNRITAGWGMICGTILLCASTPQGESEALTKEEALKAIEEVNRWRICPEGTAKPAPTMSFRTIG